MTVVRAITAALAILALTATSAEAKVTKEGLGDAFKDLGGKATSKFEQWTDVSGYKPDGYIQEQFKAAMDIVHDQAKGAKEFFDDFSGLSGSDKALDRQSRGGGPKIPSKCASSIDCQACFSKHQGDFEHLRFSFAKLRAIGKWTEDFTTKSKAFGDDVSAIHGVAGIAWQAERRKIESSYESFGKIYDAKYEELMGDLETTLKGIGQCEAKHFGDDDWYDRYGYLYYSFMVDNARR